MKPTVCVAYPEPSSSRIPFPADGAGVFQLYRSPPIVDSPGWSAANAQAVIGRRCSDADVAIQLGHHRIAEISRGSEFGDISGRASRHCRCVRLGFSRLIPGFSLDAAFITPRGLVLAAPNRRAIAHRRSGYSGVFVSGHGQFRADAAAVLARDPQLVRAVSVLRPVNDKMASPYARCLRSSLFDRELIGVHAALDPLAVGVFQWPVEFRLSDGAAVLNH